MTDADLKRLRDLPAPPPAPPGAKEAAIAAALDAFDRARPSAIVVPLRPNEAKVDLFQDAEYAAVRAAAQAAPAAPSRRGFSRRGGLALAASLALGVIAVPLMLRHLSDSSGSDTASTAPTGATQQAALDAKASKDPVPAAVARTEANAGARERIAAAPPPPAAVAPPQPAPAPGAEAPVARSAQADVEAVRPEPQQSPQGAPRARTLSALPPPAVAGAGAVPGAVEVRPSSAAPAARPAERTGPTLSDAGQGGKLAQKIAEHEWIKVAERPVAVLPLTFERHVREPLHNALKAGRRPANETLDIAGLLTDFAYTFPRPKLASEAVRATVTVVRTPWRDDSSLVHVALLTYDAFDGKTIMGGSTAPTLESLSAEIVLDPRMVAAYRLLSHPARVRPQARSVPTGDSSSRRALAQGVGPLGHGIPFALIYEIQSVARGPEPAAMSAAPGPHAGRPKADRAAASGRLRLHFKTPGDANVVRRELAMPSGSESRAFADSPPDVRLGIAVTAFGLWLAESPAIAGVSLDQIQALAKQAAADSTAPDRLELLEMIRLARTARR